LTAGPSLEEIESPPPTSEELTAVIEHLQSSVERERVTLSRALHDDLGGLLVSAVMDVGWIEQHQTTADLRERLSRVRSALAAAIDLKRNLIEDLRPSLLDNFGLFAAYRWHVKHACARAGVTCKERYPAEEIHFRPDALGALFRIMQEMLQVIFTEKSVKEIDVSVETGVDELVLRTDHSHDGLEISDVFQRLPTQMGAITRRINTFGGRFTLQRHDTGTSFSAYFPIQRLVPSP